MSAALRDRTLRWIAGLFAASVLLEWAVAIALMVLVYAASGSAAAAAGMLVCTQLVPNMVVATMAGRLDGLAVAPVFIAATLVQAAGTLAAALLGYGISFYLAAFLIGAGSSVARGQLRTGVARADAGDGVALRAGNALLGLVRGPAGLLGPVAAGVVVATSGPQQALLLFGVAQLVVAAVAFRAPRQRAAAVAPPADDAPAPGRPSGVSVTALLALTAVVVCVFSVDEPILLAYAQDALGSGAGGYSALLVAWGVGLTIGAVLYTRLLAFPILSVFAFGLALNMLGHAGMVLAPSLNFALVAALVGGLGNGMDWSALATAVQDAAPAGLEASVAARLESLATLGAGVGIVLGGVVADQLGARMTLLIPVAGGAVVVLATMLLQLRLRAVRPLAVPSLSPSVQGGAL